MFGDATAGPPVIEEGAAKTKKGTALQPAQAPAESFVQPVFSSSLLRSHEGIQGSRLFPDPAAAVGIPRGLSLTVLPPVFPDEDAEEERLLSAVPTAENIKAAVDNRKRRAALISVGKAKFPPAYEELLQGPSELASSSSSSSSTSASRPAPMLWRDVVLAGLSLGIPASMIKENISLCLLPTQLVLVPPPPPPVKAGIEKIPASAYYSLSLDSGSVNALLAGTEADPSQEPSHSSAFIPRRREFFRAVFCYSLCSGETAAESLRTMDAAVRLLQEWYTGPLLSSAVATSVPAPTTTGLRSSGRSPSQVGPDHCDSSLDEEGPSDAEISLLRDLCLATPGTVIEGHTFQSCASSLFPLRLPDLAGKGQQRRGRPKKHPDGLDSQGNAVLQTVRKGVYRVQYQKTGTIVWRSTVYHLKRNRYLGSFNSELETLQAYDCGILSFHTSDFASRLEGAASSGGATPNPVADSSSSAPSPPSFAAQGESSAGFAFASAPLAPPPAEPAPLRGPEPAPVASSVSVTALRNNKTKNHAVAKRKKKELRLTAGIFRDISSVLSLPLLPVVLDPTASDSQRALALPPFLRGAVLPSEASAGGFDTGPFFVPATATTRGPATAAGREDLSKPASVVAKGAQSSSSSSRARSSASMAGAALSLPPSSYADHVPVGGKRRRIIDKQQSQAPSTSFLVASSSAVFSPSARAQSSASFGSARAEEAVTLLAALAQRGAGWSPSLGLSLPPAPPLPLTLHERESSGRMSSRGDGSRALRGVSASSSDISTGFEGGEDEAASVRDQPPPRGFLAGGRRGRSSMSLSAASASDASQGSLFQAPYLHVAPVSSHLLLSPSGTGMKRQRLSSGRFTSDGSSGSSSSRLDPRSSSHHVIHKAPAELRSSLYPCLEEDPNQWPATVDQVGIASHASHGLSSGALVSEVPSNASPFGLMVGQSLFSPAEGKEV